MGSWSDGKFGAKAFSISFFPEGEIGRWEIWPILARKAVGGAVARENFVSSISVFGDVFFFLFFLSAFLSIFVSFFLSFFLSFSFSLFSS